MALLVSSAWAYADQQVIFTVMGYEQQLELQPKQLLESVVLFAMIVSSISILASIFGVCYAVDDKSNAILALVIEL